MEPQNEDYPSWKVDEEFKKIVSESQLETSLSYVKVKKSFLKLPTIDLLSQKEVEKRLISLGLILLVGLFTLPMVIDLPVTLGLLYILTGVIYWGTVGRFLTAAGDYNTYFTVIYLTLGAFFFVLPS